MEIRSHLVVVGEFCHLRMLDRQRNTLCQSESQPRLLEMMAAPHRQKLNQQKSAVWPQSQLPLV